MQKRSPGPHRVWLTALIALAVTGCAVALGMVAFRVISLLFVVPAYQPPLADSSLALRELWCSSPGFVVTQIVSSNEFVYVRTSDSIKAIDKKTGQIIWTYPVEDDAASAPPTLHDNYLVVVSKSTATVVRLDAASGQVVWSTPEELAEHTPMIHSISVGHENAYVAWANFGLTAYDVDTGMKTLTVSYQGARIAANAVADPDDNVYVSEGHTIHAYDRNGNLRWQYEGGTIARGITQHQERLYVYQDGMLRSLRAGDGSIEWEQAFGGKYPPHIDENTIFVPGSQGEVLALDRDSGQVVWRIVLPTNWPLHTPAILGNRVYVESLDDGTVFVLDKSTGQQIGRIQVAIQLLEPNLNYGLGPKSDGERLYVPSGSALCAYQVPASGE